MKYSVDRFGRVNLDCSPSSRFALPDLLTSKVLDDHLLPDRGLDHLEASRAVGADTEHAVLLGVEDGVEART